MYIKRAKEFINMTNKEEDRPKYYDLVDALVSMACQYLENANGEIGDNAVSAGEHSIEILEKLGLIKDKRIIDNAYNYSYLKSKFND